MIETFPKTGCRLVAPVETGPPAPTPAPPPGDHEPPTIAALAFDNLTGDPAQEVWSDGLTVNILTELSRFRDFTVIACNSTFSYKGQAVDLRRIGAEIGVQYVVAGSFRRDGDAVRVAAELADAASGRQLRTESHDRALGTMYRLEGEVAAIERMSYVPAHARPTLAAAYARLGRIAEAQAEIAKFRAAEPAHGLGEDAEQGALFRDPAMRQRWLDGLRLAGLPD